jgi:hypothetical protein
MTGRGAGEGAKLASASSTFLCEAINGLIGGRTVCTDCSNSSWVIFDNDECSRFSTNETAPMSEDR